MRRGIAGVLCGWATIVLVIVLEHAHAASEQSDSLGLSELAVESKACYSVYTLKQTSAVSVNFGLSMQNHDTTVSHQIHVRRLDNGEKTRDRYRSVISADLLQSYLFMINPEAGSETARSGESGQRYTHPFIVYVNNETGAYVDITISSDDKSLLTEYRSFYDLFQYSRVTGKYTYRDGNGTYLSELEATSATPNSILKRKTDYISATVENKKPSVDIVESHYSIVDSQDQTACFFKSMVGLESLESVLSGLSMFTSVSRLEVALTQGSQLPDTHLFFSLDHDTSNWPGFKATDQISQEQALNRMPLVVTHLSASLQNDEQFLETMLKHRVVWPHIAQYLTESTIADELSKQLFWALDTLDTRDSVNALVTLATAPLSKVDKFRSLMALSSTSSTLTDHSVELLKNHFAQLGSRESLVENDLVFIRIIGALASRRLHSDPAVSADLRDFIYTQSGVGSEQINSAVIASIGNLKSAIDGTGEQILMDALKVESPALRESSVAALTRVPGNSENSHQLIQHIAHEPNVSVKKLLVEVLSKGGATDDVAKSGLLAFIDDEAVGAASLEHLSKTGFDFNQEDMQRLKDRMRIEDNIESQKALARIILSDR